MKSLIEDIKNSRSHKIFLGSVLVLTILAGLWKFSPEKIDHVSARQVQIEKSVEGF